MEYVIYADESTARGRFYSNFYGGVMVRSVDLEDIKQALSQEKQQLNLHGEVKWSKVTANYLDKYSRLVRRFFSEVQRDRLKIRVMFTQNANVPELEDYHRKNEYHLLYYQFIKHAFGLPYSNPTSDPIKVRLYLDRLPDTKAKNAILKGFLNSLQSTPAFRKARILIPEDQIAEVDSHEHVLLQCLDIVLGSMQFRLNDRHKDKPEGQHRRGKRTLAKEQLYKIISREIRAIYPNFNIGISTSQKGEASNRWQHPYRHWLFRPQNFSWDRNLTKK